MKGSLTKVCKTCKQELSVSEFRSNGKGKRKHECKWCFSSSRKAITARWMDKNAAAHDEEFYRERDSVLRCCTRCKLDKPGREFNKQRRKYGTGYASRCRECSAKERAEKPAPIASGIGKTCRVCKEFMPYAAFHVNKETTDGYVCTCKRCTATRAKNHHRSKIYGISTTDYAALLVVQDGRCAICRRLPGEIPGNGHRELAIDHNHKTGKVRGLLCSPCNTAIGLFSEDILLLKAAGIYLELTNKDHTNAAGSPTV